MLSPPADLFAETQAFFPGWLPSYLLSLSSWHLGHPSGGFVNNTLPFARVEAAFVIVSAYCATLIFLSCSTLILGPTQAWLPAGGATTAIGLRLRARAPGNRRHGKKLSVPGERSVFFKI